MAIRDELWGAQVVHGGVLGAKYHHNVAGCLSANLLGDLKDANMLAITHIHVARNVYGHHLEKEKSKQLDNAETI